MATYPYKCNVCGRYEEVIQSITSYSKAPIRPVCHDTMVRVITIPMIAPDYQPFVSQVDGTVINSRSAHREYLKRTGMVMYDEIAPDLPRIRQAKIDESYRDLKADIYESVVKLEQGYQRPPQQDQAVVLDDLTGDVDVRGGLGTSITETIASTT